MEYPYYSKGADPVTREIDDLAEAIKLKNGHITKLQSRQLAWLKRWSRTEGRERLRGYYLECHDCCVVESQHVAAVMAQMVFKHAGHDTWLRMLPGSELSRGWRL